MFPLLVRMFFHRLTFARQKDLANPKENYRKGEADNV
jgi:hypothetical protein